MKFPDWLRRAHWNAIVVLVIVVLILWLFPLKSISRWLGENESEIKSVMTIVGGGITALIAWLLKHRGRKLLRIEVEAFQIINAHVDQKIPEALFGDNQDNPLAAQNVP